MFNIFSLKKSYYDLRKYDAKSNVFFEGEICTKIGYVIKGELRITSVTSLGNEIVLRTVKEGEFFGNNLIYSKNNKYRGTIKCTDEHTEVAFFTKNSFEESLSSNREFLSYYLSLSAKDGDRLNKSLRTVSIQNMEERFFYYLSSNGGSVSFNSVTDLALELNIRRETLSRLISSLQKEGKIIRERKTIRTK